MTIRVLVADDQEIVRTGLRMILDAQPGIEVVGEAADGRAAVALARQLRPDVCLFDIRMPAMDGIEATRTARPDVDDPLAIVVITTFDLDEYVYGALRAGARGFLLKDAGPELLVQAIHAAANGDALIAPNVTVRLLAAFSAPPGRPPVQPIELSPAGEEVLVTVAWAGPTPRSPMNTSASAPSRPTSPASWPSSAPATASSLVARAYDTNRIRGGRVPGGNPPGAGTGSRPEATTQLGPPHAPTTRGSRRGCGCSSAAGPACSAVPCARSRPRPATTVLPTHDQFLDPPDSVAAAIRDADGVRHLATRIRPLEQRANQ